MSGNCTAGNYLPLEWKKRREGGAKAEHSPDKLIPFILPRKTTTSLSSLASPLSTLRAARTAQLPHFVNEPGMLNY